MSDGYRCIYECGFDCDTEAEMNDHYAVACEPESPPGRQRLLRPQEGTATMNTDAMLAVADLIEEANRFNLRFYAGAIDEEAEDCPEGDRALRELRHHCNTAGCVAGWTLAWRYGPAIDLDWSESAAAQDVLDLTDRETMRLFFPNQGSVWHEVAVDYGWEPGRGDAWTWAEQITAAQAADVLRRIARGEVAL
jgi:hypothetical protein